VITGGYNPTMLYAFGYTLLHGKKHIPISDAWALSEQHLSAAHKTLRWLVFLFSKAFIACSEKGKSWYESYGLKGESIFVSPYTIDNERFANDKNFGARKYDLLFSGQFTERKNPGFFARVAIRLRQQKKDLRVLLLGDGLLRESVLAELRSHRVDFEYGGQAKQEELPGYYSDSKLFLFPTANDAWGVVANEAVAAGTPVIVSPYAGCANELIQNDRNGYILPLEEDQWVEKSMSLLTDEKKWASFSAKARESALHFTHEQSAASIIKACAFAGGEFKLTP
jgi:glycosyltransferase involved in cell wall biosynthesis